MRTKNQTVAYNAFSTTFKIVGTVYHGNLFLISTLITLFVNLAVLKKWNIMSIINDTCIFSYVKNVSCKSKVLKKKA